jgi:hypothetical protein
VHIHERGTLLRYGLSRVIETVQVEQLKADCHAHKHHQARDQVERRALVAPAAMSGRTRWAQQR